MSEKESKHQKSQVYAENDVLYLCAYVDILYMLTKK